MSTFCGLGEVIAENGLFCSLYADRAFTTGTRPRQAQGQPDPGRPGLGSASSLIAAYSPQRPGPLGAHVRDLAEAPAPGAAPRRDRHHGRGQSLSRSSWPAHNARYRPPGRGHRLGLRGFCRHARGHPLRPGGTASSRATTPCATRTARCRSPANVIWYIKRSTSVMLSTATPTHKYRNQRPEDGKTKAPRR